MYYRYPGAVYYAIRIVGTYFIFQFKKICRSIFRFYFFVKKESRKKNHFGDFFFGGRIYGTVKVLQNAL